MDSSGRLCDLCSRVTPAAPLLSGFLHGTCPSERTERLLARTTYRTFPVIGKFFETRALRNLSLTVAPVGIIDVTTVYRLALPYFLGPSHDPAPPNSDLHLVLHAVVLKGFRAAGPVPGDQDRSGLSVQAQGQAGP